MQLLPLLFFLAHIRDLEHLEEGPYLSPYFPVSPPTRVWICLCPPFVPELRRHTKSAAAASLGLYWPEPVPLSSLPSCLGSPLLTGCITTAPFPRHLHHLCALPWPSPPPVRPPPVTSIACTPSLVPLPCARTSNVMCHPWPRWTMFRFYSKWSAISVECCILKLMSIPMHLGVLLSVDGFHGWWRLNWDGGTKRTLR